MGLSIISGPPNSGRAGLVRERFTAALGRDPVLVVPTVDDVFAFESELAASTAAVLGGRVLTFDGLFEELASALSLGQPAELSGPQRARLIRVAVARTRLRVLAGSARNPGFATALEAQLAELQGARIAPAEVEAAAEGRPDGAYLRELASLYGAYVGLRDGLGMGDRHLTAELVIAELGRDPSGWGARPVFLYGFDDLTPAQLALVRRLAKTAEVLVALTYEDRDALSARARLVAELSETAVQHEQTEPDPSNTESELLFHLERSFLVPGAARAEPREGLTILRCAGERGEAEAIAAEIALLLAGGTGPDAIAVAVRDPARRGPLIGRVLEGMGIPVAIEAPMPVATTATGSTLAALLRATLPGGTAQDLLAYLRGPRRAPPGRVDRLEDRIRRGRLRTVEDALAAWSELGGEEIRELATLRELGSVRDLAREIARTARDIAEWPLKREERQGDVFAGADAIELRAGRAIALACEELAELGELTPHAEELEAELGALSLPLWSGPVEGRVRVAAPYRLRAGRFRHVFVASLQDGEFPRHGDDGPFLSEEQRAALGLQPRTPSDQEERYLFYVCLSLPERHLWLSHRICDEAGVGEAASPFLDDVRRLLAPEPPLEGADPALEAITRARDLDAVVFDPAEAPSEQDLARSIAAAANGSEPAELLASVGVEGPVADRVLERIARADAATFQPTGLKLEAVLSELGARPEYGGTTLEGFAVCSYRWFVDRELGPRRIDPDPEGLAEGSVIHRALERLYRERPEGEPRPRPGSVEAWIERGGQLVAEAADERGISDHDPVDRASRRRAERLLEAFLRREAASDSPLEPALLEASFGVGEEPEHEALDLGGWGLHGFIDRIDTGPTGGVVYDYKLSRETTPHAKFVAEGKLQLPLYMLAARELWGIEPIAGLYQPLRPTKDPRPRGLARADQRDGALASFDLVDTDWLEPEEFEQLLAETRARATAIVERMRRGDITRDPIDNKCPPYCTFAPICRRERGEVAAPEEDVENGEEGA